MLEKIPDRAELRAMMGPEADAAWQQMTDYLAQRYEMDVLWDRGGRAGPYECKYRRGGRTLCALYPGEGRFGFMVVLGQKEREGFEAGRPGFSQAMQALYDGATTYHDGKWLMVDVADGQLLDDMKALLRLKRRPNKK
jgi:hypothetical protein